MSFDRTLLNSGEDSRIAIRQILGEKNNASETPLDLLAMIDGRRKVVSTVRVSKNWWNHYLHDP